MKRELKEHANNLREKSIKLRNLAVDEKIGFEKSQEIRAEQDKIYKKLRFTKELIRRLRKEEIEIKKNKEKENDIQEN